MPTVASLSAMVDARFIIMFLIGAGAIFGRPSHMSQRCRRGAKEIATLRALGFRGSRWWSRCCSQSPFNRPRRRPASAALGAYLAFDGTIGKR